MSVDGDPSSAGRGPDATHVRAPAADSPAETRADRIRRRFANHRLGALLILGTAVLAAIGGAVGGIREIIDVLDGSPDRPKPPVRLSTSELRTAKNTRFGFSFQYPVTWERQDPINGDGLAAIGPERGLEVAASGSHPHPSLGPDPSDVFNRLEYLVHQSADAAGSRIVDGPTQQNVTRFLPGGGTSEVAGSRFVLETDPANGTPALTSVVLATTTNERDVTMRCQVPKRLASSYRGVCNQLVSTLTLTR
jgi:hypothetical protein